MRSYGPANITVVTSNGLASIKLGKTASETNRMLKEAFGDNALGQKHTREWLKHFKNGRMSVDEEECSGRTSTGITIENVAKV